MSVKDRSVPGGPAMRATTSSFFSGADCMTRLKTTLLAVSLLTASPVFAQTNITGDWDITVTSPQGPNTTPATFKQEGDKVSGMFKSPQGELPFDSGTMTGSDVKFTFTINFQGNSLPITLTGKV